ncbi:MAG: DNA polymerase ligase N-terminal domain-containing protein [Nanoarchaeota archaeon]
MQTEKPIQLKYVIQKHQATHLHWDLRLEQDGVLKSWACPKEPTMDPSVKRLLIQVDDHDLSYGDFHGTGEGGDIVEIWDSGTYTLIDEKPSKWIVDIQGKRLQGEFVILKFEKAGKKEWLFFKKKN